MNKNHKRTKLRKNDSPMADEAARLVLDEGMTREEAGIQTSSGSELLVRVAVAREEGRREVRLDPRVEREALESMTAKEKLDAAIRQHQRKLDVDYAKRVLAEVRRRLDQIVLPSWKEKIDEAQRIFNHRKGIMDKALYNTIRRALHPDSRNALSNEKLAEAFNAFASLEKFLLDEADSPTQLGGIPESLAEWDAARIKRGNRRSPANIAKRY